MSYAKGRKIGLEALPMEVVYSIFSCLSTPSLLPSSSVSRRIHNFVHQIIHQRILSAVQITDHKLTLDYFYPVIEKTKSPIEFKYNGTYQSSMNKISEDLRDLYSHFLSIYPEANPVRLQPIDKQNSLISTSQDLIVEPYESISQLCIIARLLRPSAHEGVFRSCITLGVNVIRVWRN